MRQLLLATCVLLLQQLKFFSYVPSYTYDPQPDKTCHSSISPISQKWLIGQENLRP